jgi:hypothetical protein
MCSSDRTDLFPKRRLQLVDDIFHRRQPQAVGPLVPAHFVEFQPIQQQAEISGCSHFRSDMRKTQSDVL